MNFSFTTQLFPDGTVVGVFDAEGYDTFPASGPPGDELVSATVEASVIKAEGLEEDRPYFAAAKVGGEWRSTRFITASAPPAAVMARSLASGLLEAPDRGETLEVATQAALNDEAAARLAVGAKLDNLAVANAKDFGAKGDGATDDTAALQAAIDAAAALGEHEGEGSTVGGLVFIPAGSYIVTGLVLKTGVTLAGEGVAATWIRLKDGANAHVIKTNNLEALVAEEAEEDSEAPYRLGIRDLTIYGNHDNNTKGFCLAADCRRMMIDRVCLFDGAEGGLYSRWHSGGIEVEWAVKDLVIRGCTGTGLDWGGPHDSTFDRIYIENHEGDIAAWVRDGAGGPLFDKCHIYGDRGHKVCWKLDSNAYLRGCQGEGASEVQVHVNSDECEVTGGHYYGTGASESDGSVGILFGSSEETPSHCLIDTRASRAKTCVKIEKSNGNNRIRVITEAEGGQTALSGEANVNVNDDVSILTGSKTTSFEKRVKLARAVASATKVELSQGCDLYEVSGTATIEEIPATYPGHLVTLIFSSTAKVKDGKNLKLASELSATADDALTLRCDGTNWFEDGRSAN